MLQGNSNIRKSKIAKKPRYLSSCLIPFHHSRQLFYQKNQLNDKPEVVIADYFTISASEGALNSL